jgi:peptidoglycan/LPS O-acetylase OafA/YrhL
LARALLEFTVGIFAYRFYSEGLLRTILEKDATLVGIVAMIAGIWLSQVTDGLIALLLLALLPSAVSNKGRMRRVINVAPLRWLGDVSYSVYISMLLSFTGRLNRPLLARDYRVGRVVSAASGLKCLWCCLPSVAAL